MAKERTPAQAEKAQVANERDLFEALGDSGLKRYSGYVDDEYLKALVGKKGANTYKEMSDNDPVVGTIIFTISQIIKRTRWFAEPAKDLPPGLETAAEGAKLFAEGLLEDMEDTWEEVINEILTMLVYGYAPMEVTYKFRRGKNDDKRLHSKFKDGKIGVRKLALRAQNTIERWEFDTNGEWLGVHQQPPEGGPIYLPREKVVLFKTTSTKGNPEGRSILRNAYRPWFMKKKLEIIEAVGAERDLAGYPVLYLPADLIARARAGDAKLLAVYNSYKQIIRNIRRDEQEGIILPGDRDAKTGERLYELELLSSGSKRNFDTNGILQRYTQEISSSVLADFVLLGHTARGTQALATSKVDVFLMALQGFQDVIASTLNRILLPQLWELNRFPDELMPKFNADDTQNINAGDLATLLGSLSSAGMPLFPDPELEKHVRDIAGLPEPSPEILAAREAQAQVNPLGYEPGIDPTTGLPLPELGGSPSSSPPPGSEDETGSDAGDERPDVGRSSQTPTAARAALPRQILMARRRGG